MTLTSRTPRRPYVASLALLASLGCATLRAPPGQPDASDVSCGSVGQVSVFVRANVEGLMSCPRALELVQATHATSLGTPWRLLLYRGWCAPAVVFGVDDRGQPDTHTVAVGSCTFPSRRLIMVSLDDLGTGSLEHNIGHALAAEGAGQEPTDSSVGVEWF